MLNINSISSSHRQVDMTTIMFLDNKGNIKLKDPGLVSSCIHKRQKILKLVSPKDVCLFAYLPKCDSQQKTTQNTTDFYTPLL